MIENGVNSFGRFPQRHPECVKFQRDAVFAG
jgi:hypothetical protein